MSHRSESIKVSGMHCTSCEARIEREIKKLVGIINVKASYNNETVYVEYDPDFCTINSIKNAIKKAGYDVDARGSENDKIIGILIIALAVYMLGRYTGGFDMSSRLSSGVTYAALFVIGLLTSIHCLGMCGGIMLSQTISKDYGSKLSSIKPAIMYNIGRLISYTVLGGIVGAIGSAISISPKVKSGIMIFAGVFMVIMGLNMAGFNFLRKFTIRLPWSSCSVKSKAKTPFVVGLFNGLMPCGPLQTMQLYALGTGSAIKGAFSMFVFALGTIPLMMFFGAAAGLISKGYTKKILKFSGILVVALGLIMSNRGLALAGVNLSPQAIGNTKVSSSSAAKAEITGGVQTIRMTADYSGYTPNVLFVQKGIPVKWIINGEQITSCNNAIIIPSLNIEKQLKSGENIIEFTPGDKDINFSCWMGMIRGIIKVVDDINSISPEDQNITVPSSGGGCCNVGGAPSQNPFSNVPTDKLIKKASMLKGYQSISVKGTDDGFDPLVSVAKKDTLLNMKIDLSKFTNVEGKFEVIDGKTGDIITTFTGKKGVTDIKLKFTKSGGYGILKDGALYHIIEVVDDLNKVNLEQIRDKYIN